MNRLKLLAEACKSSGDACSKFGLSLQVQTLWHNTCNNLMTVVGSWILAGTVRQAILQRPLQGQEQFHK